MKNTSDKKIPVGILGATGMVGQRFISLLVNHPWFEIVCVAASERSAGKNYAEAVAKRWTQSEPIPNSIIALEVLAVEADQKKIAEKTAFVFSAVSLEKAKVREIENQYGRMGIPVVSCNSAHRWTEDVPMIIPEINPHHTALIDIQRKNRKWDSGLIAVKPNCSIQSYVPVLEAWKPFEPEKVIVATYQAVSGAGKTLPTWPEMEDNVIPFIGGEEKKSEDEPLKIWGILENGQLKLANKPRISSTCIRIPVTDGHMAVVHVLFKQKPSKKELLNAIHHFKNPIGDLGLPSSPEKFIQYFEEEDRPQTALDRDLGNGMGISVGRLRQDAILDWKFVALSHNTVRGAAGGALLVAELLAKKGYITGN
jgi:aspartate-semialdehyde dehydrogenase